MYIRDLLMSLRRRWYLALVAVIIAALGSYTAAFVVVPPDYEQQGSVVLIPPKDTADPQGNRFLNLGSLGLAMGVVIRALNSDKAHAAVALTEPNGDFTATYDYATSAPIIIVSAEGHDPAVASRTVNAVLTQVPVILDGLQEDLGIKAGSRIVSVELTRDVRAKRVYKTQLRAAVAVGLGIAGVLFLGIAVLDGYLVRRRSLRDAAAKEEAEEEAGAADEATGGVVAGELLDSEPELEPADDEDRRPVRLVGETDAEGKLRRSSRARPSA